MELTWLVVIRTASGRAKNMLSGDLDPGELDRYGYSGQGYLATIAPLTARHCHGSALTLK